VFVIVIAIVIMIMIMIVIILLHVGIKDEKGMLGLVEYLQS